MYHGIKYKGLRYKLFSFRWKRKNRNWKDCPKKRKAMKKDWEMKVKNNGKNRKKDNIDLICEELTKYNEQHGTSYSYGEYTALVGMGKIKSKHRNKRDIDLPLL